MFEILFALVLFATPTPTVSQDRKELSIQDTLHVTVEATFDESLRPDVEPFIETFRDRQSFGSFAVASATPTIDKTHLKIAFELRPLRLGTLYFAPGLLSFTREGSPPIEVLVPAFQIDCKRQYEPLTMMPPLPVHPEEAITMSAANVELSGQTLEQETKNVLAKQRAHALAWVIAASLIFICGTSAIAFLLLREWRARFPKPKEKIPPPDWNAKIDTLLQNPPDFFALSALLRELIGALVGIPCEGKLLEELADVVEKSDRFWSEEKKEIQVFLEELAKIEFKPDGEHKETWERAGRVLKIFRSKTKSK